MPCNPNPSLHNTPGPGFAGQSHGLVLRVNHIQVAARTQGLAVSVAVESTVPLQDDQCRLTVWQTVPVKNKASLQNDNVASVYLL